MDDSPGPEVRALLAGGALRTRRGCKGAGGVGPIRVYYLLWAGAIDEEPSASPATGLCKVDGAGGAAAVEGRTAGGAAKAEGHTTGATRLAPTAAEDEPAMAEGTAPGEGPMAEEGSAVEEGVGPWRTYGLKEITPLIFTIAGPEGEQTWGEEGVS